MPLKRLIAAGLLLVAVAAGAVAALALARVEAAVRPDVSAKLEAVGRTIAGQVGLALDYGIPFAAIPRMEEFLAALTRDVPEVARVRVTDAAGTTLYALGPAGEEEEEEEDGPAVSVPVLHGGVPAGAVVLGLAPGGDAAGTDGLGGRLVAVAMAAAVAGGGLLGLAGWWWAARPLRRLRAGLDAVAGGGVDIEFPENAAAEVGALARAAERLRADVDRRHGAFAVEMEEIALAQPDAVRRAAVERLSAEVR